MIRVGVHAHDLGADIVRRICQIDAVAQRFAHFRFSVDPGQAEAGRILRNQRFRLHQHLSVNGIELSNDLPALLDHRQLILTYGNRCRLESGNVRSLTDGIGEEAHRNAGFKIPHLDL